MSCLQQGNVQDENWTDEQVIEFLLLDQVDQLSKCESDVENEGATLIPMPPFKSNRFNDFMESMPTKNTPITANLNGVLLCPEEMRFCQQFDITDFRLIKKLRPTINQEALFYSGSQLLILEDSALALSCGLAQLNLPLLLLYELEIFVDEPASNIFNTYLTMQIFQAIEKTVKKM